MHPPCFCQLALLAFADCAPSLRFVPPFAPQQRLGCLFPEMVKSFKAGKGRAPAKPPASAKTNAVQKYLLFPKALLAPYPGESGSPFYTGREDERPAT